MTSEPGLRDNDPMATPLVTPPLAEEQPRFSWRLFLLLAAMMLVSSLLIIPYALQLSSVGNPEIANQAPRVVAVTVIQVILLYFPLLAIGLLVAGRLGLGAPYLHAIAERRPMPPGFLRRPLVLATGLGLGLGVVVLLLAGAFSAILPKEMTAISPDQIPNAFQGFMASISAGINEEILLRLFLLSLIAWLIQLVAKRTSKGRPGTVILWVANVLAAVIFGLLHLPNVTAIGAPITPAILAYVILLNGLAGVGFGWLYWTFGLEAAMLAHFATDIVLHVITRLFT